MRKTGFTLIEIIIAIAIVVTILSVVYATCFATSSSVERCRTKIDTACQARTLLEKMSRQIRCISCIPHDKSQTITPKSYDQTWTMPKASYSLLEAPADKDKGHILCLVTSAAIFHDKLLPHGPFQVVYKYDPDLKTLFYSQQKYISIPENNSDPSERKLIPTFTDKAAEENWITLSENIARIELHFYDNGKWLNHWSFREKLQLPKAVKIELTLENTNLNSTTFTILTYVTSS